MPFSPGTRFGSYEVAALIGVGGMGEVYRAADTKLKRGVAIKVLPPSFASDADWLARFQREAETLAALNHQNIAHVYGLERVDGTMGLVMELVDGPTIADRIAQGRIPLAESLSIAAQIADALDAAHERGIVHRDLKPANIKLRADGAVKVLDFGIAKLLAPAPATSGPQPTQVANTPTMTQLGMILGTAAYMSPEQARGKPVDKRTDVWAFGCVLYEMLTGKAAFGGEDVTETIGRVLEREADMRALPADVPSAVRQTLAVCLQKDAKKRVRDIGDVKLALAGAFEPRVGGASRAAAEPRGWRRAALPAATFAGGAAAVVLAAWQWWAVPQAPVVTRLSIPIVVADNPPVVGISRDGARLAYWPGDSPSIQVRDLGAFTPRALLNAVPADVNTGVGGHCFSPDGAWIAFSADGGRAIKKASLAGGAAIPLAQGINGVELCDWADDGNVYFDSNAGIMRVPALTGRAEVVLATQPERGEAFLKGPQLLPGGKSLLLNAVTGTGSRVEVLDLATGSRKTVLEGVGAVYFSSRGRGGYLLYGLNGSLFAAPFDLARFEKGEPRLVADDFAGLRSLTSAAVSRSGTLAYVSGRELAGIAGRGELIEMDRAGTTSVLPVAPRNYVNVELAPDGKRAAFAVVASGPPLLSDLWTYDLSGDQPVPATFGGVNYGGLWTADGRALIGAHLDSSNPGAPLQIQSVPADNSAPPTDLGVRDGDWRRGTVGPSSLSPDGKTLLIMNDAGSNTDILAVDLGAASGSAPGAEPRPFVVTGFSETGPAFSPDGRLVAYTSNKSGTREIYVQPYPGPGGQWQVSLGGGRSPRWNPNGRELFYLNGDKLMAAEVETSPVFRVLERRALFTVPRLVAGRGIPYAVFPDGQGFLMLRADSPQTAELKVVVNWLDEFERGAGY
ncbi:MAG TPA: protein kinase [Gammaproteobacteria bacterium]|nr:protein kinase [Gammaproteobacteria bacterium]